MRAASHSFPFGKLWLSSVARAKKFTDRASRFGV